MTERGHIDRRRLLRHTIVVVAIIAFVVLSLGVGDVVRAAFEAPPAVKPYDPMPHW